MENQFFDEKTVTEELEKIKVLIKKNKTKLTKLNSKSIKSKTEYENIHDDVMSILFYLGLLSQNENMKDIREMYEMASRIEYPYSPKKATKLFLRNYAKHTERFDVLKEQCWTIINKTSAILNK